MLTKCLILLNEPSVIRRILVQSVESARRNPALSNDSMKKTSGLRG